MLKFNNLTLGYENLAAVYQLNASIESGEFIALVGPNGGGKSTLLKAIMGEVLPSEGSINLSVSARKGIAYLPQLSKIDRSFPMSVEQLVSSGLWRQVGLFKGIGCCHKTRIHEVLFEVGMSGFANRMLDTLSGGQFQRVLFARMLLQNAQLLLLDEPFAGVDEKTTDDLLLVLKKCHERDTTIIAVMHDLDLVREHFPSTMLLSNKLIAKGASRDVLRQENLTITRQSNPPIRYESLCKPQRVTDYA